MTKFDEQYIEHEVQLRVHDEKFKVQEKMFDAKFAMLEKQFGRLESKLNWIVAVLVTSYFIPVVLHYFKLA